MLLNSLFFRNKTILTILIKCNGFHDYRRVMVIVEEAAEQNKDATCGDTTTVTSCRARQWIWSPSMR